mgnify:CR=1 FL=1
MYERLGSSQSIPPRTILEPISPPQLKMLGVDFQKRIKGLEINLIIFEISNTLVYSANLSKFGLISECL